MRRVAYNRRPYGRNGWSLFRQLHVRWGSKLKHEAMWETVGSKEGVATQNWQCGMSAEFCSAIKSDSLRRLTWIAACNPWRLESFDRGTGSTRLAERLGMRVHKTRRLSSKK